MSQPLLRWDHPPVPAVANQALNPGLGTGSLAWWPSNNPALYELTLDTAAPISGNCSAMTTRTASTPSVIAGGIFAFISAMDETIVALFISGGQYQPLTKRMFTALRDEIDPTIAAISTLMTAVSFMLVLIATSRSKKAA